MWSPWRGLPDKGNSNVHSAGLQTKGGNPTPKQEGNTRVDEGEGMPLPFTESQQLGPTGSMSVAMERETLLARMRKLRSWQVKH